MSKNGNFRVLVYKKTCFTFLFSTEIHTRLWEFAPNFLLYMPLILSLNSKIYSFVCTCSCVWVCVCACLLLIFFPLPNCAIFTFTCRLRDGSTILHAFMVNVSLKVLWGVLLDRMIFFGLDPTVFSGHCRHVLSFCLFLWLVCILCSDGALVFVIVVWDEVAASTLKLLVLHIWM